MIFDVNDVILKFEKKFYFKLVWEDNKELELLDDRKILMVFVKDDDVGDNVRIFYSIIKGNEEGLWNSGVCI